ncbi:MAG: alpha/beta hydrolase [Alphaproteobacteria bacterium]
MTHLVFVHGWGFDSSLWDKVIDELPDFECEAVDFGFSGHPKLPNPNGAEPVIAIGHSLGFLWLLHERPVAWRALVSIGGMPRFTKAADYRFGVDGRILDATIARFEKEPAETLSDFIGYCGCARAVNGIDRARLGEALRWLKEWDARGKLAEDSSPLLALFADNDAIVPKELSEDIFGHRHNTKRAVRPDGGHALPLTEPRWCATAIREFVESLP